MPIHKSNDSIDLNPPIPFNQRENLGLPVPPPKETTTWDTIQQSTRHIVYELEDGVDSVVNWIEMPSFSMMVVIVILAFIAMKAARK